MRDQIKKAFADLRKQQILAKMNFWCCSSCGGSALATQLDQMPEEKARQKKGFVFYHNQDEQHYQKWGVLYLRYDGIDTQKYPDNQIGFTQKEVGELVVSTMKKYGVPVKWDGNPHQCILVADKEELLEGAK